MKIIGVAAVVLSVVGIAVYTLFRVGKDMNYHRCGCSEHRRDG